MKILYVGDLSEGGTCLQRMRAMGELGHEIYPLDVLKWARQVAKWQAAIWARSAGSLFQDPAPLRELCAKFVKLAREVMPGVIWVDKGVFFGTETIRTVKRASRAALVHYNPDDPFGHHGQVGWRVFMSALAEYDWHFVPKAQNVGEYQAYGAKRVMLFDRGFDPQLHRPIELTSEERQKYGSPVGFIGSYAPARAASLLFLAEQGTPLAIHGNGWPERSGRVSANHCRGPSIYGEEYVKAICGLKIALHFLRRENRDEQDSRTFEIPACGVFMLAERSPKHLELFEEGKEVEFFGSNDELLDKVRYYLTNESERMRIATAGRERCLKSGYSYLHRLEKMLAMIIRNLR